jgi:hypothetical protein
MSKTAKEGVGRRQFLQEGITTAAMGVGLSVFGLRDVLAQAKSAKAKPLLSERNLNALIPQDWQAFRRLAQEAKLDPRGFIKVRFSLTPNQTRQLDALSRADIAAIGDAVDMAIEKSKRIRVDFVRPTANSSQSSNHAQRVNVPKPLNHIYVDGGRDPNWVVVGVKGTC